jgi:hypothetical protein
MWALATAALIGKQLPDPIPKSFPYPFKQETLRDHYTPEVGERDRNYATRFANQMTEAAQVLFENKLRA